MSKNILKYLQRRRKQSLFKQWVDKADLSPEEIPPELLDEQPTREIELADDDMPREQVSVHTAMIDIDRGTVRLPIRHVLITLALIAALLIALSVVITVLIMRS